MPTLYQIYKKYGIKGVINFWAERVCVNELRKCHVDAEKHGYNLCRTDYKFPWYFYLASKIEWWTR